MGGASTGCLTPWLAHMCMAPQGLGFPRLFPGPVLPITLAVSCPESRRAQQHLRIAEQGYGRGSKLKVLSPVRAIAPDHLFGKLCT